MTAPRPDTHARRLQLDGLRALAVLTVVIEHGLGFVQDRSWLRFSIFGFGPSAVRLFFVLSGFLITGILINARRAGEGQAGGLMRVWTSFYTRRALRIFPLAYVAILAAWLVGIPAARHTAWYATYTSNILVTLTNFRNPALNSAAFDQGIGQFWTLAVEEQFYLLWPLLVLACPFRRLGAAMAGTFLAAGVIRGLIAIPAPIGAFTLLVARADSLALGGILALWLYRGGSRRSIRTWIGCGAVALQIAAQVIAALGWVRVWVMVSEWAAILVCGWLVVSADRGFKGPFGRLLSSRLMVYLGTISYGIYVWHLLTPALVSQIAYQLDIALPRLPERGWIQVAAMGTAGIVTASFTWWAFENRLNNLKRRVPYVADRTDAVTAPAAPAERGRLIDATLT